MFFDKTIKIKRESYTSTDQSDWSTSSTSSKDTIIPEYNCAIRNKNTVNLSGDSTGLSYETDYVIVGEQTDLIQRGDIAEYNDLTLKVKSPPVSNNLWTRFEAEEMVDNG